MVRGPTAPESHISLTSPVVTGYTTEDDLGSVKYLEGRSASSGGGGGAHANRHDGAGPGRRRVTSQHPLPRRGRRGLSPITPCVPPGPLPRSMVGQEVVIYQSRGWYCRSFVIVAI